MSKPDDVRSAEQHVEDTDREGGCKRQMFLGDCDECERYYAWSESQNGVVALSHLNTAAPASEADQR